MKYLAFLLLLSLALLPAVRSEAAYTYDGCPVLPMPVAFEVNGSSLVNPSLAAWAEWDINPGEEVIAVPDGHHGYVYINRQVNGVSSTYRGTTSLQPIPGDGHSVIAFASLPAGVLGQTTCVNGEIDITMNSNVQWGGKNGYSLQRAITHEIGHGLGLGHSTSGGCGSVYRPLMCATSTKTSLPYVMQEDSQGMTSLYPAGE